MTDFRQIVPREEAYQYLICWLSPNGGVRFWMFSHTDGGQEESFENVIVEGFDTTRNIPSSQRKSVEVVTSDLQGEDFEYVKSLMATNRAYTLGKDGTTTPIAILSGSVSRPNKNKGFEIVVDFQFTEENTLNV